jgi:hypothetical protein
MFVNALHYNFKIRLSFKIKRFCIGVTLIEHGPQSCIGQQKSFILRYVYFIVLFGEPGFFMGVVLGVSINASTSGFASRQ